MVLNTIGDYMVTLQNNLNYTNQSYKKKNLRHLLHSFVQLFIIPSIL